MKENLMTVKTAIAAAGTALGAFLGWKGVMLMAWTAVMALDYVTAVSYTHLTLPTTPYV